MSVFGGDSWAREAQHRKRRVDDLAVEGLDASSYKKLSSGKFACLVCPGAPVLDSALMLSVRLQSLLTPTSVAQSIFILWVCFVLIGWRIVAILLDNLLVVLFCLDWFSV
ncbi:hypothetical protein ACJRO7_026391 [Eucalyptus globulus]|uniref:Uncharacterized protein n=1 Tax=Eucalyptus globulus TaxID=34317 RepID=A0ABD3JRK1_EUCGL